MPPRTLALVLDGAGWAGTERHVRGLLHGLARSWGTRLHEPRSSLRLLVVTSEEGPLLLEARDIGAETRIIPRRSAAGYVLSLSRLLRRERPALVHAHSGRLACVAARMAGVPRVIETRHGLRERVRPLYVRAPIFRRWEGMKCRLADLTITVCEADAIWLREHGGLPRSRIRVIPNGIPPPPAHPPEADREARSRAFRRAWGIEPSVPVLGLVGRLSPQKAPERALELLARLRAILPSAVVVVCGDGPERERLARLATRLGVEDGVRFVGVVARTGSVLASVDLLLMPSIWEGMPYVLLEALAAGVPVLATPVGGVGEVLAGSELQRGVAAWDPDTWTQLAAGWFGSGASRRAWADAACARVGAFQEAATVAATVGAYEELLNCSS